MADSELAFIPCGPGTSFFELIGRFCRSMRAPFTLHRICTLMRKMGAQTVVRESVDSRSPEWQRLSVELAALRTRVAAPMPARTIKITFLLKPASTISDLHALADEDFLGYAVVVDLELAQGQFFSYIFESVIREPGIRVPSADGGVAWLPLLNNYLHVKKTFNSTVAVEKCYALCGTFFCQQNTISSVCAHACAAMVLNNAPGTNGIVTCEDINAILGIDHKKRKLKTTVGSNQSATHEGLTTMELEAVFQNFGFSTYGHDFRGENRKLYRDFLYGFVESGYPAILAFSTADGQNKISGHVVGLFGHTLNSDSWFPTAFVDYARQEARDVAYLSTLDWVPDFIVHDDNYGMYLCLPAHSFRPESHPDPGIRFTPFDGIGIYPSDAKVSMLGYRAESLGFLRFIQALRYIATDAALALPELPYYLRHLLPHVERRTAVVRTTLIGSEDYAQHLEGRDNKGVPLQEQEKALMRDSLKTHKWIWLVEISEPDLYVGNKSKVVDIVLDPSFDRNPPEVAEPINGGVILMRFPGFLLTPKDQPPYAPARLSVEGHLPLFVWEKGRSPCSSW